MLAERLPRYYAALTVPLLGESPEFLAGYEEAARSARGRVLVVALVNATAEAAPELRSRNAELLRELTRSAEHVFAQAWLARTSDFDLLSSIARAKATSYRGDRAWGWPAKHAGDLALSLCWPGVRSSCRSCA